MIEFSSVNKKYGEKEVLKDLTFRIGRGEIFTFIGPSGSGKTTILRMIDLLENPTSGSILIGGKETDVPERDRVALRRRMAVVFQKPAALRGNVHDNIALGLKFRGLAPEEIRTRVRESLHLVGLEGYEKRTTATLSGGELQRVAIARALVCNPDILLLDEPTANLDPESTERIEDLILSLNERFDTTIVLSTHDMIQGQRLATRMAVILEKTLGQVGDALDIFYKPDSRKIARMVGVENIFEGRVISNDEGLARIDINGIVISAISSISTGTRVTLYIRPEELLLHTGKEKSSARNALQGTVSKVTPLGPHVRVQVDAGITLIVMITRRSCQELALAPGTPVYATFKASAIHVGKGPDTP